MKTKYLLIGSAAIAIFLMSTKKAFAKVTATGTMRGCDVHGCGTFGANRAGHVHQGEDYTTVPGQDIFSPISGTVTRHPFPYSADLSFKGVEIKNATHSAKIFYLTPTAAIGTVVEAGQKIGVAQNIAGKYTPGMTNHVHVEVRDSKGSLLKLSDLTK